MTQLRDSVRRLFLGSAVAASVLLAASTVAAAPPKSECPRALKDAEEHEQSGHLREARESLLTCARAACGRAVDQECTTRFRRLDSTDIPSIVPRVTDKDGTALFDVDVRMDGELLTSHLDGQPVAVDPGQHEFAFSTAQGLYAERRVLIAQGEHARPLTISLRPDRSDHRGAAAKQAALPPSPRTDIPSIAPVVTDASGARMVDVEVKMDGKLLVSRLDAQEIAVDPGLHEFSFRAGNSVVTRKIMIAQGERSHRLSISLGARGEGSPAALASRARR